jgi:hypothetical protein
MIGVDFVGLRIRAGGQTGVDRAALDAAARCGLPYEGWCPKGGWAEDFHDPPGILTRYPLLQETPDRHTSQRTEWNVRDSAATVVIVPIGIYKSEGTNLTIECAAKYGKPLYIVVAGNGDFSDEIRRILTRHSSGTSLNFAGPRESECQGIYGVCLKSFLKAFSTVNDLEL